MNTSANSPAAMAAAARLPHENVLMRNRVMSSMTGRPALPRADSKTMKAVIRSAPAIRQIGTGDNQSRFQLNPPSFNCVEVCFHQP